MIIDLLYNNFRNEIQEFRAKIMKEEEAYLAKVRQRVLNDLQPKFLDCSRRIIVQ